MTALRSIDPNRLAPAPGTRVAIIGGCGGIGRVLVRATLEADLRVAVLDLPASLQLHPPPTSVAPYSIDAVDKVSVLAAFDSLDQNWDGLDVLVNLCGFMNAFEPVENLGELAWDEVINGNLRSTFLAAQASLPLMRKAGGGAIVNTASGLAYKSLAGTGSYSAAKAGVISLSKTLAREHAPSIRVNVIAPGAVDTQFLRGGTGRTAEGTDQATNIDTDEYARATPLQRLAVPGDIVGPIIFLIGDASRFMTGQVLHINGGGYMP